MEALKNFFLFCSGIYATILKRTPSDTNKYAGIGATIFFTGIFATIAAAFALYTVFKSYVVAILFGIIWGLMIFNLDRYIVMSMKKKDNIFKEIFIASPRIMLAILIAFVISKPLELKLFSSEIAAELVVMEQEVFKNQEDLLKTRFKPDVSEIEMEILSLNEQLNTKKLHRDQLQQIAIQEADGTGGSMKRNLGPIYAAKKKDADRAELEYQSAVSEINPIILDKRNQITEIESSMSSNLQSLKRSSLDGFAAQLDALGRLARRSNTIWFASLFITLLFIAIETAPIFTKLISSRSPYDYKLDEHEFIFKSHHLTANSRLDNVVKTDMAFDREIHSYKNQIAVAAEKEILKELIASEVEKIKSEPMSWKNYLKNRNVFGSL